jgi:endonuclease IV
MHHLLHHPALKHLPFIMETPRSGLKEDIKNMKKVRQLLATRPIG